MHLLIITSAIYAVIKIFIVIILVLIVFVIQYFKYFIATIMKLIIINSNLNYFLINITVIQ